MDNLIPSITTPNLNNPTPDKGVNGLITVVPDEIQKVNVGENLLLELKGRLLNGINTSVKININNQLLDIPVNLNVEDNLVLDSSKINEATAKVVAKSANGIELKFITINNDKPEKYIAPKIDNQPNQATAVITKDVSKFKTDTVLLPLKLSSMVENIVKNTDLPIEYSKAIIDNLNHSQIKLSLGSLTEAQNPIVESKVQIPIQKTLEHIDVILQNFAGKINKTDLTPTLTPALIRDVVAHIKTELLPLKDSQILGEVVLQGKNNLLTIRTQLGDVFSETPLKFNEGTKLLLDIIAFATTKTSFPEVENLQTLQKMLNSQKLIDDLKLPDGLLNKEQMAVIDGNHNSSALKSLLTIFRPLAIAGHEGLVSKIIAKIPAQNDNMLANLVSFVKGVSNNNLNDWLGRELVEQVKLTGLEGKDLVSKLGGFFQTHTTEGQNWRVMEIPFFNGDNMSHIRVAIKKMQHDEEEKAQKNSKKNKYGTRFVVDTDFTKLGRFQFDGFSLERDRRFDLVVRTEKEIPQGLCADIMRIFKNTLHDVNYIGNVNINLKENFIKVCEDEIKGKTLNKGIYI